MAEYGEFDEYGTASGEYDEGCMGAADVIKYLATEITEDVEEVYR